MLTAVEARKLAGPSEEELYQDGLKKILSLIEEAAKNKKRSMRTWEADFGSSHLYGGQPYPYQKKILEELVRLGYKVSVKSDLLQFVDIYLFVEW
jgi:hypothetical protein